MTHRFLLSAFDQFFLHLACKTDLPPPDATFSVNLAVILDHSAPMEKRTLISRRSMETLRTNKSFCAVLMSLALTLQVLAEPSTFTEHLEVLLDEQRPMFERVASSSSVVSFNERKALRAYLGRDEGRHAQLQDTLIELYKHREFDPDILGVIGNFKMTRILDAHAVRWLNSKYFNAPANVLLLCRRLKYHTKDVEIWIHDTVKRGTAPAIYVPAVEYAAALSLEGFSLILIDQLADPNNDKAGFTLHALKTSKAPLALGADVGLREVRERFRVRAETEKEVIAWLPIVDELLVRYTEQHPPN